MNWFYVRHVGIKVFEIVAGYVFLTRTAQAIVRRMPLSAIGGIARAANGLPPGRLSRVAVIAHVYYPELLHEVLACWANVVAAAKTEHWCPDVVLHITTVESRAVGVAQRLADLKGDRISHVIHVGPNRGRDIAPFIALLNTGVLDTYQAVLKLHTKRSPHLRTGDLRRRLLFTILAGSIRQGRQALRILSNRDVGMLGWVMSFRTKASWWMNNEPRVQELATRMTPPVPLSLGFFEGSMFWVKPAALASLRSLNLNFDDFETEEGQVDGALHHAIERAFTLSAWAGGYRVCGMTGAVLDPRRESAGTAQAVAEST